MTPIERLRALARETLRQYGTETAAGGEPAYPAWVDDVTAVCDELERLRADAAGLMPQKAEPSDEHVSVVGMPEFDALLDHIYEYGTASEGIIDRANAFARAIIAQARADLIADREGRQQWQPIQTAPHGQEVLLGWVDWDGAWITEVAMATRGWRTERVSTMSSHGRATHWQPLPAPPADAAMRKEGGQ